MRGRALFFVWIALLVLLGACGKKNDSGTNNGGNGGNNGGNDAVDPGWKRFTLAEHGIATEIPCYVNVMFQVFGPDGQAAWFLKANRFRVLENDVPIDPSRTLLQVQKKSSISYELRTVLLIDNRSGAALDSLKAAALAFVQKIVPKQTLSVWAFSDAPAALTGFTSDVNALTAAVSGIAPGAATGDLFGAFIAGASAFEERYALDKVVQGAVVVLVGGPDTQGAHTAGDAAAAVAGKQVYAVVLGDVDSTVVKPLAAGGFRSATAGNLRSRTAEIAAETGRYSDSFYMLNYMSETRGFFNQNVKVSIPGNENTGAGTVVEDEFRSSFFQNPPGKGLYVNWSKGKPAGVDTVIVKVADTLAVRATTIYGPNPPAYSWSSDNTAVLEILQDPFDPALARLAARGQVDQSANVTVTDAANNLTRRIHCKLAEYALGSILYEYYGAIGGGTTITDLRNAATFPDNPTERRMVTLFEAPKDWNDNYGCRIRGYLTPPATGEYTFWIASDDASELWLSTDINPDNIAKIAGVNAWTNSQEWGKEGGQQSRAIPLQQGKFYYVEALMKEGGGGDNLAVAWLGPGIAARQVIQGQYLAPVLLSE